MKSLFSLFKRFNPVFFAFMVTAFILGIAGALQAPTLSLFLSREVQVPPLWVGLFFTINAIAGIVVSMMIAKRSDSVGDRRNIILLCCILALANAILFAFTRHYLTLITLGVLLSSLANVAMPQLFALAREYADSASREVVMFSSIMRAQVSLAWVIGPPLSFALALNFGFVTLFSVAAGLFFICFLLVWFTVPSVPRTASLMQSGGIPLSGWRIRDVRVLFAASTLMWTCNTMYIIDMPLWISNDLGLPENLAGLLMGTAAGLEIPVMILAGFYAKRWGKRNMMVAAVASAVVFYSGLILFHSHLALLILQVFNALFIGVVAGIGMLWFQDLMPGRAGAATTLFTNSISTGIILAGLFQGMLVEHFGHGSVYWVIAAIAVLTLVMIRKVKDV
ncbi:MFS transporter [Pantoea allii]|uniref:MFS transporter n=1 Tax=Pantoea allii TaxID=574096 RepID=A0A2V2BQ63_9GAMM|nr:MULTISPECIES: MFS transporter [Pantoea]MBW1212829.1 MFS transporter [Pantoea allii]MBW1256853.1 MFS transporter [Pantoea allii]MBW1265501.1 MFS transporter [Pantoea allii]MBW1288047.1 MFS transporter [Pantoea allii]MDJ0090998.1 MFS transporter [Pantoea allii]